MGDWSEYFEDFPEENPANWVGDRYDPAGAERIREAEEIKRRVAVESQVLQQRFGVVGVVGTRVSYVLPDA